jgi:ketosteroid isomerase-like protein
MSPKRSSTEGIDPLVPGDAANPQRDSSRTNYLRTSGEQIMKMRVLLTLSALGIGFTVPAVAQQKDTTDSQLAQQLEASGRESEEGFNKGDAAAIAALFTQDAVLLLEDGPVYGKPAIEKWLEGVFQNARFSNHLTKVDQKVPPLLSKAGDEAWWFGEWSTAVQGKNDGPVQQAKGYWSAVHVREGDAWKTCMLTIIQTPKPPATGDGTPSAEATPSDK